MIFGLDGLSAMVDETSTKTFFKQFWIPFFEVPVSEAGRNIPAKCDPGRAMILHFGLRWYGFGARVIFALFKDFNINDEAMTGDIYDEAVAELVEPLKESEVMTMSVHQPCTI